MPQTPMRGIQPSLLSPWTPEKRLAGRRQESARAKQRHGVLQDCSTPYGTRYFIAATELALAHLRTLPSKS